MTLISPRKAFPPSPAGAILVLYIAGIPATVPASNCSSFPRPPQKSWERDALPPTTEEVRTPGRQKDKIRVGCSATVEMVPKFRFKFTVHTPPFPPVFESLPPRRAAANAAHRLKTRSHLAALVAKNNGYTRCEGKTRAAAARCMQGPRRRLGFAADIARRLWRCARRLRRRQRKR
jgi:hypothetical protein